MRRPCMDAQVGRDSRDVMQAAYTVFQDGSDPARILQAADIGRGSGSAFYANLVSGHTDSAMRFRLCLMQTGCCALILIDER